MRNAKADIDLKRQALSQVFPETLAAPLVGKCASMAREIARWLKRL
jgi:integrase/recombinase XerD